MLLDMSPRSRTGSRSLSQVDARQHPSCITNPQTHWPRVLHGCVLPTIVICAHFKTKRNVLLHMGDVVYFYWQIHVSLEASAESIL